MLFLYRLRTINVLFSIVIVWTPTVHAGRWRQIILSDGNIEKAKEYPEQKYQFYEFIEQYVLNRYGLLAVHIIQHHPELSMELIHGGLAA